MVAGHGAAPPAGHVEEQPIDTGGLMKSSQCGLGLVAYSYAGSSTMPSAMPSNEPGLLQLQYYTKLQCTLGLLCTQFACFCNVADK